MRCEDEAGWKWVYRGGDVIKIKEVLQSLLEINYLLTKVKVVYIDYMEILAEL